MMLRILSIITIIWIKWNVINALIGVKCVNLNRNVMCVLRIFICLMMGVRISVLNGIILRTRKGALDVLGSVCSVLGKK